MEWNIWKRPNKKPFMVWFYNKKENAEKSIASMLHDISKAESC